MDKIPTGAADMHDTPLITRTRVDRASITVPHAWWGRQNEQLIELLGGVTTPRTSQAHGRVAR